MYPDCEFILGELRVNTLISNIIECHLFPEPSANIIVRITRTKVQWFELLFGVSVSQLTSGVRLILFQSFSTPRLVVQH